MLEKQYSRGNVLGYNLVIGEDPVLGATMVVGENPILGATHYILI